MIWSKSAFMKLAAKSSGAVVFLPTSNGKYLMERNPPGSRNAGLLRPPGGGRNPEDKDQTETIIREIGEEFTVPEKEVRQHIKFLGYTHQREFWGTAVYEFKGHGLKPGKYQASNHPDEKITLEEVTLDHPDYCGPTPHKLITEAARDAGDKFFKNASLLTLPVAALVDGALTDNDCDQLGQLMVDLQENFKSAGVHVKLATDVRMEKQARFFHQDEMRAIGSMEKPSHEEIRAISRCYDFPDESRRFGEFEMTGREAAKEIQERSELAPKLIESLATKDTDLQKSAMWDPETDGKRGRPVAEIRAEQLKQVDPTVASWVQNFQGIPRENTFHPANLLMPKEWTGFYERMNKQASFRQPENFDKIEKLCTREMACHGGGNDWENCHTALTFRLSSEDGLCRRVWAHLNPPQDVVDATRWNGEWGEAVARKWLSAARIRCKTRAKKMKLERCSLKLEDFNEVAKLITEIKEHGIDKTEWVELESDGEKSASALTGTGLPKPSAGSGKNATGTHASPGLERGTVGTDTTQPPVLDAGPSAPPLTGPEAIAFAVGNIDLDAKEKEAHSILERKLISKRPDAVKTLGFIEGYKRTGMHPRDLLVTKVPVIPPAFRPYTVAGETFVPGDANELYRDLINVRDMHSQLESKFGPEGAASNKLRIYDAVSSVYGFGEPVSPKTRERGVSGFLKKVTGVSPKFCHDDETEILTRRYGWVAFKDLKEDTEVATVNPETKRFEWQQPTDYCHARYIGEMVQIKIGYRADMLVTPSHRMWLRGRATSETLDAQNILNDWEIAPASSLPYRKQRFYIPTASVGWNGTYQHPEFVKGNSGDFAEFVGWWVAEGWIHTDQHAAELSQSETANPEYVKRITEVVENLGIPFSFYPYPGKHTWSLQSKELVAWLIKNCNQRSVTKELSRGILDWPMELLQRFLKGYLKGDGSKRLNVWENKVGKTHKFRNPFTDSHASFVTTSRALFDNISEIGTKLGLTVNRAKDYPHLRRENQVEQFTGSVIGRWFCTAENSRVNKLKFVPYDGHVHCCSVPNGLLITRRNFKSAVSGNSFPQRKLLSKDVDYTGRGVIAVDPDLELDEIGLPDEMCWKLYGTYVQRRLVRSGMEPADAMRHIRDRTPVASKMMDMELPERPVIYSRAPSWHKFNAIGGKVKRIPGSTIMINPLVTTGMNADFDGDQLNVHVPSMPSAVEDVREKLMPSKMLFSIKDRSKVMPTPKQEFVLGLFNAQRRPAKQAWNFPTQAAALKAIQAGQVRLSDEITIGAAPVAAR